MNVIATALASCLAAAVAAPAFAQENGAKRMDLKRVAPDLEKYRNDVVLKDLWRRPQLSARDRSIVTVSALIARNQMSDLRQYLELALDSGVKPSEISEIITHLAFYAGSGNATEAVSVAAEVFKVRGIPENAVRASGGPVAIDEKAEAERAQRNEEQFGAVAPGLLKFTTDVLFRDLWLRSGLAPRDRSFVTVSALIANGQVGQVGYHLNRAMDNGLKRDEAGELLAHLAFYVGWPNAFSAAPVVKDVLAKRVEK